MKEDTRVEFDQKIYDKWEKTGLINGIDDQDLQRKVLTLLENQAKYIKQISKDPRNGKEMKENPDYQLALSIVFPVIRRIFGGSGEDAFKPIDGDWDVMNMPVGLFEGKPWTACTEKLRTKFDAKPPFEPGGYLNLDPEVEMISILTEKLKEELEARWSERKVYVYVPIIMMGRIHYQDIGSNHHQYCLATRFASKWNQEEGKYEL